MGTLTEIPSGMLWMAMARAVNTPARISVDLRSAPIFNAVHEQAIDARDGNVFGHRETRAVLGEMKALDIGER